MNAKDLRKKYVNIALSHITRYQERLSDTTKEELIKTLEAINKDFGEKLDQIPRVKLDKTKHKKLTSLSSLKRKFVQNIAEALGIDAKKEKINNMRQLVDYIDGYRKDIVQNCNTKLKEIPYPQIEGTITQVGEVILPPDVLEIVNESMKKGEILNKAPAGFDKIGLVEKFLSKYFGKKRSSFDWEEGILYPNQRRKISYFYLYLPEVNKTLLLNNQYGEGCFVIEGDFRLRHLHKSQIKEIKAVIPISFDYKNPNNFLDRLICYLEDNYKKEEKNIKNQKTNNKDLNKEDNLEDTTLQNKEGLISYIKQNPDLWFETFGEPRERRKSKKGINSLNYTKICRILGFNEEANTLVSNEHFKKVTDTIFGENEFEKKYTIKILQQNPDLWFEMFGKRKERRKSEKIINDLTYINICRILEFNEKPYILYEEETFKKITDMIFGENYYEKRTEIEKNKLIESLQKDLDSWFEIFGKYPERDKSDKQINSLNYIEICRILGFNGEHHILQREDNFKKATDMIFGESAYENYYEKTAEIEKNKLIKTLQQDSESWFKTFGKSEERPIADNQINNLTYTKICRILGFNEERYILLKEENFKIVTDMIFGESAYENYYEKIAEIEKNKLIKSLKQNPDLWFEMFGKREERNKSEKEINDLTYINICRILRRNEGRKLLRTNKYFKKITDMVFGEGAYEKWKQNNS